jgi:hypothetical protein
MSHNNSNNSNSNSVPNTPEELLALNKNRSAEPTETCCFLRAIEGAVEEFEPDMEEMVNAAELLLMKLARWHYDVLKNEELPEYSKTIWADDLSSIKKALRNLRAVERQ